MSRSIAVLLALVLPRLGWANCPSPYNNDSCNDECEIVGSGVAGQDFLSCDFNDETAAVEAHAVTDYDDAFGTINYSVFGETPSGGEFCCWFDDPDGEIVLAWMEGSDSDDFLECNWATDNLYYLDDGQTNTVLGCRIDGYSGEDTITGSDAGGGVMNLILLCLNDECDFLSGMGKKDELWGFDGGDWLAGGTLADEMHGGGGGDIMWGDGGDDDMRGNSGDDLMTGEEGEDVVRGGPGTDQVLGGDDADVVCGGGGTSDIVKGEGGADTMWVPTSSVTPTGESDTSDHCGDTDGGFGNWADPSCIYDLSTKPTEC